MCNKISTSTDEFIEALVGEQHLAKGLISIRLAPRPLDSSDVVRFSNKQAEASRSTKLLDLLG